MGEILCKMEADGIIFFWYKYSYTEMNTTSQSCP